MSLKKHKIALVEGDGSAPEMMAVACSIAEVAMELDGMTPEWYQTHMGWKAYKKYSDTLPPASLAKALEIGTIFFGGVGDPKFDNTIGAERPEMKPEARCLLPIREHLGLLLNFRPMIFYKDLAHLAGVRPERIPEEGVQQIWIRYLLQDSYFGNSTVLRDEEKAESAQYLGVKLKKDVTGKEELVADYSFYTKAMIEKYIRAAFKEAVARNLPLISIDKANVMSRYDFWRKIVTRIHQDEFHGVKLQHQLVDSANALLFKPALLHGVIACGNEHGDILSDGAAGALGSMGLMCSSAINPDTGAAMFESGAGTAPDLAGQDKANPLGRILTAAMMLRHLGSVKGAAAIELAVGNVLRRKFRTGDLLGEDEKGATLVGTREMGKLVLKEITG